VHLGDKESDDSKKKNSSDSNVSQGNPGKAVTGGQQLILGEIS